MGAITIIREIKQIHPNYVALVRMGGFYRVYGKDAYILSNIFEYKIKQEEDIVSCGFPTKAISKVMAKLESKKINYMIVDSRDNYDIEEKMEFKNLNTYEKQFEASKIYVNNQKTIEKINEYLIKNVRNEKLKNILKEMEELINAKGKI